MEDVSTDVEADDHSTPFQRMPGGVHASDGPPPGWEESPPRRCCRSAGTSVGKEEDGDGAGDGGRRRRGGGGRLGLPSRRSAMARTTSSRAVTKGVRGRPHRGSRTTRREDTPRRALPAYPVWTLCWRNDLPKLGIVRKRVSSHTDAHTPTPIPHPMGEGRTRRTRSAKTRGLEWAPSVRRWRRTSLRTCALGRCPLGRRRAPFVCQWRISKKFRAPVSTTTNTRRMDRVSFSDLVQDATENGYRGCKQACSLEPSKKKLSPTDERLLRDAKKLLDGLNRGHLDRPFEARGDSIPRA